MKGVLGGLLGMVGLAAIAGMLATAAVTPAIAIAGVSGSKALSIFENLPNSLVPGAVMEPTTFYGTGTDGKPFQLAKFYDQNRVPVTFEQVSPVMYDAILSSEDKSFYEHGGVNLGATVKAVYDNVRGTSSRGASTISQQFVKNVLIQQCEQDVPASDADALNKCWNDAANAVGADGVQRKLQEMRYAIQIEKDYSKNDILLGYLNIANFGGQTYGIEAAANYYFGTTAAQLTLNQAATLAGIVQNPNRFRIDKEDGSWSKNGKPTNSKADGYADTKFRRDYVLNRMRIDGKITKEEHDAAIAEPITPSIHPTTQGCAAAVDQAYFCQYVKKIIETDKAFGKDRSARQELLKRGGLKVYTSLDMRIQGPAVKALHDRVPPNYDNKYFGGAGVTVQPATGRILAITQNTTFRETTSADQAYTSLVFASDTVQGGFPVGSAYKIFTLIDWLENGHSVNERVNGTNQRLKMTACGRPLPVLDTRTIGNFGGGNGYFGTPMRFTRDSLNSGYFAMASKLDVCDINKVAQRMGVTLGDGKSVTATNNAYDVLGSKYISPLSMASAFATVANQGVYCMPKAIDKVIGTDGKEMPLPESSCTKVIEPEIAATAAYALQGVMAPGGTGSRANPHDGTPLLGKTGSNNRSSTMMIESSTKAATAVYIGRWNNIGANENIWGKWYKGNLLENIRYSVARDMQAAADAVLGRGDQFPPPDDKLTKTPYEDLPNVVGQPVEQATKTLEDAGFQVQVGAPVDSTVAAGLVAEQTPGAGRVAGGTTVTLSPSTGNPPAIAVPNVVGEKFGKAKSTLEGAGFGVSDQGCKGGSPVTGQNPAANAPAPPGTTVSLTCGPEN
ncbi:transglycosylase domain-containing protein [uncultured Microbacterium sp.]|uniref:transglycosylase domain-containing protein n=1 Tax=uncultured Microbacterium sp. TaxID=191216 RepID=UPI00261F4C53|nr:transglycosylase domain-containing protein [uncultured Microbacterium sp.]